MGFKHPTGATARSGASPATTLYRLFPPFPGFSRLSGGRGNKFQSATDRGYGRSPSRSYVRGRHARKNLAVPAISCAAAGRSDTAAVRPNARCFARPEASSSVPPDQLVRFGTFWYAFARLMTPSNAYLRFALGQTAEQDGSPPFTFAPSRLCGFAFIQPLAVRFGPSAPGRRPALRGVAQMFRFSRKWRRKNSKTQQTVRQENVMHETMPQLCRYFLALRLHFSAPWLRPCRTSVRPNGRVARMQPAKKGDC